ncbi:hypothetical protein SAMN06265376_10154 [Dokdonia pacifica]|uniref:histidine kinase n=1 Tax=Dokdonia pacifica TaxID=1627892 RepID=A0A238VN07_9FLAO|nr:HAMP domain-containing sensor histidine kinase [Dokdonia pacifica]SNR35527.1 hypothetical protein SAMN06265376_10154 [Dokdonia pacifica]
MSTALMLLTALALFIYTRSLLDNELEEELYSKVAFIEESLNRGNSLSSVEPIIHITRVTEIYPDVLKDTLIYDPRQDEVEMFKELTSVVKTSSGLYEIKTRTLVIESEDIFTAIIVSFLSILAIAFIILFFINKSRNEKMWAPFFTNLNRLKNFSLESRGQLHLESSDIEEFEELNRELQSLTEKLYIDYNNLKQFTEDVSHETQTPLAIIQAKIENIINQNNISNKQYEELTSIQNDIQRLTQLNKCLILLAKIDNDQFSNKEKVDLKKLLENRIEDFSEITNVKFNLLASKNAIIDIDPYLAEVLCNNLLSNALKYGDTSKPIEVIVDHRHLIVKNYGGAKIKDETKIFNRFYKEGASKKSTGLGLSIVNKVCTYYKFKPSYEYIDEQHIFTINFI